MGTTVITPSLPLLSADDQGTGSLLWHGTLAFHYRQLLSPPAGLEYGKTPRSLLYESSNKRGASTASSCTDMVLMPEHFHLLITEPEAGDPSLVMKVPKQRFSRQVKELRKRKAAAQLRYGILLPSGFGRGASTTSMCGAIGSGSRNCAMHRNPVKRGLVEQPEQWRWSSFRAYYCGQRGLVRVNFQEWPVKIKARPVEKFSEQSSPPRPLIRKVRE